MTEKTPDYADAKFPEGPQILDRLLVVLERIADALENMDETESRAAALSAWRMGQGKHPDD